MTFVPSSNFRQLPPVWEIAQPFQVDATGAIAFDQNPVSWAMNHILAVVLTNPGERVMRPSYGAGAYGIVFENDNPILEQQITSAIQLAISTWEPNITIDTCQFIPQPDYSGIVQLQIEFSIGSAPTLHSVVVSLGGIGIEVNG